MARRYAAWLWPDRAWRGWPHSRCAKTWPPAACFPCLRHATRSTWKPLGVRALLGLLAERVDMSQG